METKKWYKAEDQYDRDNGYFYNYFIDLGNDMFGYYSVTFDHPEYKAFFNYIEDKYDNIKDDILDSYEFEEVDEKYIIRDCFK
jgi:hypothetical protein